MYKNMFKEFDFFSILGLFGGRRGQNLIFFNYGIYYHVIPQNVLIFFQKINEWVCFSKFSIFGSFYVHLWSKLTPKVTFSLKHGAFFTGSYHMGFFKRLEMSLSGILASTYKGLGQNLHF